MPASRLVRAHGISLVRKAMAALCVAVVVSGWPLAVGAQTPSAVPAGGHRFSIVPSASQVAYHVGETFFSDNRFVTAVGVTHGIQGDVYVDRAHPSQSRIGTITVDISQFTSDSRRRDSAIRRRWLESEKYPQAVFTPVTMRGLPETYVDGRDVPLEVAGNLKIRDVTKPVTLKGTVKLQGDVLTGTMSTAILMTDFGFDPPSILGMLKAEDRVVLDLQFTARRTAG